MDKMIIVHPVGANTSRWVYIFPEDTPTSLRRRVRDLFPYLRDDPIRWETMEGHFLALHYDEVENGDKIVVRPVWASGPPSSLPPAHSMNAYWVDALHSHVARQSANVGCQTEASSAPAPAPPIIAPRAPPILDRVLELPVGLQLRPVRPVLPRASGSESLPERTRRALFDSGCSPRQVGAMLAAAHNPGWTKPRQRLGIYPLDGSLLEDDFTNAGNSIRQLLQELNYSPSQVQVMLRACNDPFSLVSEKPGLLNGYPYNPASSNADYQAFLLACGGDGESELRVFTPEFRERRARRLQSFHRPQLSFGPPSLSDPPSSFGLSRRARRRAKHATQGGEGQQSPHDSGPQPEG